MKLVQKTLCLAALGVFLFPLSSSALPKATNVKDVGDNGKSTMAQTDIEGLLDGGTTIAATNHKEFQIYKVPGIALAFGPDPAAVGFLLHQITTEEQVDITATSLLTNDKREIKSSAKIIRKNQKKLVGAGLIAPDKKGKYFFGVSAGDYLKQAIKRCKSKLGKAVCAEVPKDFLWTAEFLAPRGTGAFKNQLVMHTGAVVASSRTIDGPNGEKIDRNILAVYNHLENSLIAVILDGTTLKSVKQFTDARGMLSQLGVPHAVTTSAVKLYNSK